jgi:hypothetical protein
MRKLLFVAMLLGVVGALAIPASFAQTSGAHFTKGGTPSCTDIGTQVECTAEVAGLGGETVVATVMAQGTTVNNTCVSPGGNTAPGQNPATPVTGNGTQTIQNPKNGRAVIDVKTATPTVTPKAAGCPNNNWTVTFSDVRFTSYTLTISQGGVTLFNCSGTFTRAGGSNDGDTSTPMC